MLTFRFTGADGIMAEEETLTSGMVGKKVRLEFSEDWKGLTKTAVFRAGSVTRDVVGVSDVAVIPAEVLARPLQQLFVGVYGVSHDGSVTPTIRAEGPRILPGVDPSGEAGTDPDLPVWAQMAVRVSSLEESLGNLPGSGIHIGPTQPAEKSFLWIDTGDGGEDDDPMAGYYTSMQTDAAIRSYVDAALGVIEDGAY